MAPNNRLTVLVKPDPPSTAKDAARIMLNDVVYAGFESIRGGVYARTAEVVSVTPAVFDKMRPWTMALVRVIPADAGNNFKNKVENRIYLRTMY